HQPRIGGSSPVVPPPLGVEHRRLLLRLADEQHSFRLREFLQIGSSNVVLSLPFAELHDRNALSPGERFHGGNERLANRVHQHAGSELVTTMKAEETGNAALPLQWPHVVVQVHPVDSLDLQGHVIGQDFGHGSWYAHFGSGTTPILRDRLPLRRPKSLARTACSSPLSTGATSRIMRDRHMPWKYTLSV